MWINSRQHSGLPALRIKSNFVLVDDQTGAVRRVAHAHYDTYVIMKPDSRPDVDGTAIRDHARVRVLRAIHARAVLDAMAKAEAAVAVIEEAPQTVSPSEVLPAASRCSSLSVVPCRISTRP